MKIHLLGPSGSGTSSLGKLVAETCGIPWFDSDGFFWLPTDPPFTMKRETGERVRLLEAALRGLESWVLSGSMLGWGDFLKPRLDLVIYKYVEKDVRIPRLERRERGRFGERIEPGHDMHEAHLEFIRWAERYEEGGMEMRSRMSETEWLSDLRCPVLRLERSLPLGRELELVREAIAELHK